MLRTGPTLSFEFFPPKTEMGFWGLHSMARSIAPLNPDFVSVTRSPARPQSLTVGLTARLRSDIGLESMAHLTCAGSDERSLTDSLDELTSKGVENVMALRGDMNGPELAFPHADSLVSLVKGRHPGMCVGAACYPETHPEAPNAATDLENLKRKVDAGADFLVTQLFLDNSDFLRFRDAAEGAGIHIPIVAGIMPLVSAPQAKRFTKMCGARIPDELASKIAAVGGDADAVRHIGMFHATQQCLELRAEGVAGLHFYTLNRSSATRAICQCITDHSTE